MSHNAALIYGKAYNKLEIALTGGTFVKTARFYVSLQ